jgi:Ring finger domain
MSDQSQQSPNFYCHICAQNVSTRLNPSNAEEECCQCAGTFVERLGQGVEEFLSPVQLESQSRSTQRRARSRSQRRRGDAPSEPSTIIEDIISVPGQNGGSVGIVIRQSIPVSAGFGTSRGHPFAGPAHNIGEMLFGALSGHHGFGERDFGRSGVGRGPGGFLFGGGSFEDFLHHILMSEPSHAGAPPASERTINALTREVVTEETNLQRLGECCISQEAFQLGETAVQLPCGHAYKQEPIVQWLKMHNTCPVCRVSLPDSGTEENTDARPAVSAS